MANDNNGGFVSRLAEQAAQAGWQVTNMLQELMGQVLADTGVVQDAFATRIIRATPQQAALIHKSISAYNRRCETSDHEIRIAQFAAQVAGAGKHDASEVVDIPVVFKKRPATIEGALREIVQGVGARMSYPNRPLALG